MFFQRSPHAASRKSSPPPHAALVIVFLSAVSNLRWGYDRCATYVCCWRFQVDLLPSDGKSGDGPERPGLLAAATQKQVGSLKDVLDKWEERLPGATVLPISALEGINTVDVSAGRGPQQMHVPRRYCCSGGELCGCSCQGRCSSDGDDVVIVQRESK